MRLEREFDEGDMQAVKQSVGRWQVASNVLAARQLEEAGLLLAGARVQDVAQAMQTNVFAGIESGKCETSARRGEEGPLVLHACAT